MVGLAPLVGPALLKTWRPVTVPAPPAAVILPASKVVTRRLYRSWPRMPDYTLIAEVRDNVLVYAS